MTAPRLAAFEVTPQGVTLTLSTGERYTVTPSNPAAFTTSRPFALVLAGGRVVSLSAAQLGPLARALGVTLGHAPEEGRPVFTNLSPAAFLASIVDTLTGELGGAGGEYVSEAREHVRAALGAAPDSPAYFDALALAQGALTVAIAQRPPSPRLTPDRVVSLSAAPLGLRLALARGGAVTLPKAAPYRLTPSPEGAALIRLDAPALYLFTAAQVPALLALGFDAQQLAQVAPRGHHV